MDRMTIETHPDKEAVCFSAACEIVSCAAIAISERGRFTLALSGGSTPKRLYEILAEDFQDQVEWPKVHFFWGDERSVPPDHDDSNFRMATEALAPLKLDDSRIHRMEADREDRDAAASEYQAKIASIFGVDAEGDPPAFDMILLGMGPDGHTASLFPETDARGVTDKGVAGEVGGKLDAWRLTFTRPLINQAEEVLFLVAGADKADPLFEVFTGPPEPQRLPSQLIRPQGHLSWYVDSDAVARLIAGIAGANDV